MTQPTDRKPPTGVTSPATDSETGDPGDSRRRSLFALDAMLKRGLIPRAEYERRRKAIEAGN